MLHECFSSSIARWLKIHLKHAPNTEIGCKLVEKKKGSFTQALLSNGAWIISSTFRQRALTECCCRCIVNQKPYAICYGKINKESSRRKSYTTIHVNINQSANTFGTNHCLTSASAFMVNRNIHVRHTHTHTANDEWISLFICTWQTILFIRNKFDNRQ